MSKVFNTTAVCIPEEHYMVNIARRLQEIKALVDDGKCFLLYLRPIINGTENYYIEAVV